MCAIGLLFPVGNLDFTLIHYIIYGTFKTLKLSYYVKALVSETSWVLPKFFMPITEISHFIFTMWGKLSNQNVLIFP